MLDLIFIIALALTGCYRSSGSHLDYNAELEADNADALDSLEETDALEGIEYENLPACDPAVVANRFWEGCGDGILEPGEECDDGNVLDGDGCTWNCLEGDGSGGIPDPSPLPLPRYCGIDGIHKVVELERWWAESPIIFWWNGSDYRVLFHEVREGPSGHWDQSYFRLISFDRRGENIRTLGEIHHDFHDSEYPGQLSEIPFCHFSRFDSSSEIYLTYSLRESGRLVRSDIAYIAIDGNGDILQDETPLYCSLYDLAPFPHGTISRGDETFYVDLHDPGSGTILTRDFPSIGLCRIEIEEPLYAWDTSFAEDGAANHIILYDGYFIDTLYDLAGFFLGIPSSHELPSDLTIRHLCSLSYPGSWSHNGNIRAAGDAFDLFFNCDVDNPERHYLLNPMFARVGADGELSSPPRMVLPDGYVERYMDENCQVDGYVTPNVTQLHAAVGADTLGVLYVPNNYCRDDLWWVVMFQTLDMEGRQVGEPCELAVDDYLPDLFGDFVVVDVVWDGEGYGVVAFSFNGIYFWRYLPE